MKMIFLLMIFTILTLISFVGATFENAYCFDYYEFQTGVTFENFQTERTSYSPGDTVKIIYDLKSNMKAPIVEGFTRVQIFYMDPEKGEEMIDEFFTSKDIYLMQNDSIRQKIEWKIPMGVKDGEYVAKIYLLVGDMFNLAGLSIVPYGPPGVPGDMTTFRVVNGGNSRIYFDKDTAYLNEKLYVFGDFVPILSSNDNIKITVDLVNEGGKKDVDVELKIYEWDDLTEEPMEEYTILKTITLNENGRENIVFETPPLEPNAYEVKFTAVSGEEKSILKMRFGVAGSKGRFIYAGLSDFPLEPEKTYTVFICISNAADHVSSFTGKGIVILRDENGDVIYRGDFGPLEIPPTPMGLIENFSVSKRVKKATLTIELQDSNGITVDKTQLLYDYSKFPNIPTQLRLKIDKDVYTKGEMIHYTVDYSANDFPLDGNLLIYFIKPDGTVMYTKEVPISGTYTGKIKVVGNDGVYILKVRELTHDLVDKRSIKVSGMVTKTDGLIFYAIIIILIIAVVVYLYYKKQGV